MESLTALEAAWQKADRDTVISSSQSLSKHVAFALEPGEGSILQLHSICHLLSPVFRGGIFSDATRLVCRRQIMTYSVRLASLQSTSILFDLFGHQKREQKKESSLHGSLSTALPWAVRSAALTLAQSCLIKLRGIPSSEGKLVHPYGMKNSPFPLMHVSVLKCMSFCQISISVLMNIFLWGAVPCYQSSPYNEGDIQLLCSVIGFNSQSSTCCVSRRQRLHALSVGGEGLSCSQRSLSSLLPGTRICK